MCLRKLCTAASVSLLCALSLNAVEPGKPSKSSIWVLAARAIGAREPDPSVRNPDWLAERFLGPEERALLVDNSVVLGLNKDYREAMKDPETRARVLMVNLRTHYIDQKMLDAIKAGATQVVILGAGFESRAYRFRKELKATKVFEVDFGPTQEYKKRRVQDVLGPPPPNLVFVPIDFTRQTASAVLRKAGYRADRKTFFIWEGVSMYLTEQSVRDFLRDISNHASPTSELVFDHFNPFFDPPANEANARLVAMLKQWGEPWIFAIPDGQEQQFLASTGLTLTEHVSLLVTSPDARKYITRQDGTSVGDVQFPAPGTPQRTVHWLALTKMGAPAK